jgi:hypothetical protein
MSAYLVTYDIYSNLGHLGIVLWCIVTAPSVPQFRSWPPATSNAPLPRSARGSDNGDRRLPFISGDRA